MSKRLISLHLLAFPLGLMGLVQSVFAVLSFSIFHDHEEADFLVPSLSLLFISFALLYLGKKLDWAKLGFRDALLYAVLTWVTAGFAGAIPIIRIADVSITDGVFESVSALTTTGATILSGLDHMPKTFLLYRQFLQWLGGLGIVIFVVAVLPMLNIGGMRLLKAETPGPIKDDKLTPRVAHTAHYLWLVYFALTFSCAFSYYLCGMTAYDAIAHSFTTVSTGGFSTHDASMGYFDSHLILLMADIFMIAGAINFGLHFRVWSTKTPQSYFRDEETRIFLKIIIGLTALIAFFLITSSPEKSALLAVSDSLFHVISFITSTGYGAAGYTEWPAAVTMLLVISGYLGGCAGSTAGGNKIIRNILTVKVLALEIKRLIHPKGVFSIRYQGKTVEKNVISATMSFMFVAAFSTIVLSLLLMATGLDFWSSFTAVAACLNVLGPAFGTLGSNFQPVSDIGTWILSMAMILGRLEYFTVLTLFSRLFWR